MAPAAVADKSGPSPAALEVGPQPGEWTEFVERACSSSFLYLGEKHDEPLHHQVQLKMFRQVLEKHPRHLKLAIEMAQIPSQPVLDEFIAGRITVATLPNCLNWAKTWGFNYSMYSPILELCQEYGVPVRAMRFSSESSRRLGKEGLAVLSPAERQGLDEDLDPTDFGPEPDRLRKVFAQAAHGHATEGPAAEEAFQRFLRVQVLWEEGMAAQILQAYEPGDHMVVLVGAGHLTLGHGLPARVSRRNRQPDLFPPRVLLVDPTPEDRTRADLVWWSNPRP